MDLSKAFDTLNHDLLIANLHAYGFSEESLHLIKTYLTNRWQRTKVNTSFSNWTNFYQEYHKGLFLDRYSLIYVLMIFFMLLNLRTFAIMPMTLHFMLVTLIFAV